MIILIKAVKFLREQSLIKAVLFKVEFYIVQKYVHYIQYFCAYNELQLISFRLQIITVKLPLNFEINLNTITFYKN